LGLIDTVISVTSLNDRQRKDVAQAEAAQLLGRAAFREGALDRARKHLRLAHGLLRQVLGEQHPAVVAALSDVGAVAAAMGDYAAAESAHAEALAGRRTLYGAGHPEVALSLHNLGAVLLDRGRAAEAAPLLIEALGIWQTSAGTGHLAARTVASLARIDAGQAGLVPEAVLLGALALLPAGRARATVLHHLGVHRRNAGDVGGAADLFLAAVQADPGLEAARHNLAACLMRLGIHGEARAHVRAAMRGGAVLVERCAAPLARVLIPSIATQGNTPLSTILPADRFTRIWWFADLGEAGGLPDYDLVFNGIGDADLPDDATAARLAAFVQACGKPILNRPCGVAGTRRQFVPELLAGVAGLVVPAVIRVEQPFDRQAVEQAAARAGLELPLLLRPAGAHGGQGLFRLGDWSDYELAQVDGAQAIYLTAFHDFRSGDGLFRKYRLMVVGGAIYPYHLAIAEDWLVHYYRAGMTEHPERLAEEAAFLQNPRQVLGETAWAAAGAMAARVDLDYYGIDCAVLRDGRLLLFEVNATMLVHAEDEGSVLAFKNPAVAAIVDAAKALVISSASLEQQ
jgi:tetratricopeptide (TPR) repeat protein